jgi:hypothetical protein
VASAKFPERISRANFAEPVTFVRSPIIWKLLSGRMVRVSRPESWVRWTPAGLSTDLGGSAATAWPMAAM